MIAHLLAAAYVEAGARGLSLAADVLGWSCDRFADVAQPTARALDSAAGWARWIATATRCTP